jgi:hypothetical protein
VLRGVDKCLLGHLKVKVEASADGDGRAAAPGPPSSATRGQRGPQPIESGDRDHEQCRPVRPEALSEAIPDARLKILRGDHIGAIGDPDFKRSIVDFLTFLPSE